MALIDPLDADNSLEDCARQLDQFVSGPICDQDFSESPRGIRGGHGPEKCGVPALVGGHGPGREVSGALSDPGDLLEFVLSIVPGIAQMCSVHCALWIRNGLLPLPAPAVLA
jgi:hypothetical protein